MLLDAAAAARLCGVSRATWFCWDSRGRIPRPLRLSERIPRWRVEELRAWLAAGAPPRERWEEMRGATG